MPMIPILVGLLVVPYVVAYVAMVRLGLVGYYEWPYPAMLRLLRRELPWKERRPQEKIAFVATLIHWMMLVYLFVEGVLGLIRNALRNQL